MMNMEHPSMNRRAALALVGLLAVAPAAAQQIDLSAVTAGTGGFVIDGEETDDSLGISVSGGGDVNGDGLADLVVGASRGGPKSFDDIGFYIITSPGRSYVVFGKSSGMPVDLTEVTQGLGSSGFSILAEAMGGFMGLGIGVSCAGDVNGDGLSDFILLSNDFSAVPGKKTGRSYVVFGRTSPTPLSASELASGISTLGFVIDGEISSLPGLQDIKVSAAGDVNGDGMADLILSNWTMRTTTDEFDYEGRSYVVFGKTSGAPVPLSQLTAGSSSLGFVINGYESGEKAGIGISSAGDVNGDGLADLIVGASTPGFSVESVPFWAGRSYVVFGRTTTSPVALGDVASGTSPLGFAIKGSIELDVSGISVSSAGDVNGDGLSDLLVGATASQAAAGLNNGRAYVVFGKTDSSFIELSSLMTGTSKLGFVIAGHAPEHFGFRSSSAGDVNGDGLADVIVGAPYANPPAGFHAGRVYVVLGKASPTQVNLSDILTGTSGQGFVINGQSPSDVLGLGVSGAGDVDGDGLSDVIVGAPGASSDVMERTGRSYVIFSPYTPAASASHTTHVAAGNPDRQGIGTHRFGNDSTVFAESRLWIDFDGGSGPGLSSSSSVTATITRNDAGLADFFSPYTANVKWHLASDRVGQTSTRVTVRYTDAEIAGLNEGDLVLYTAPTTAGPFAAAGNFTLTPGRNEAAGNVATLPAVFVLSVVPPTGGLPLNGDADGDGSLNVADLTAIHNLLAGIVPPPLLGDGDVDNDADVDLGDANALREFLVNGTPLP